MRYPLIKYRCAKVDHQEPSAELSDTLTIHEREWAYCAFNTRARHHDWVPTGGLTYEEMRGATIRPRAVLPTHD